MKCHRSFLRSFRGQERGSILIIFALSVTFLIGMAGAGVDLGRQQLQRMKLQQALDAAVVSAASLDVSTGIGTAEQQRRNAAIRYFNLNYPAVFMGRQRPTATPNINETAGTVELSAASEINTSFVKNFGIPTLKTNGRAVASLAASARSDYDVITVVDQSGSMTLCVGGSSPCVTRFEAMRRAMRDMANSILPPGNTNPNVRMGMIGFSRLIHDKWGLSSRNEDIVAPINNMRTVNENFDHVGMKAGRSMAAGGSSGVTSANFPITNGTSNTDAPAPRTARSDGAAMSKLRYMVFLSDGGIMLEPTANNDADVKRLCKNRKAKDTPCYDAFAEQCNAAKATGAHIYIILFDNEDKGALPTLTGCASQSIAGSAEYPASVKPNKDKDFFFAQNGLELSRILTNITTQIRSVRISQ